MLRNIDVQFEPIDQWPGERTRTRRRSQFKASLQDTYRLLETELAHLGCKRLVIQADCDRSMIRQDGLLRANARLRGPGIILAFDSKHGPLRYPCDTFTHWDCNMRAIALALQALRAVDRYGVTKRAEQYRGWQPLPAPPGSEFESRQAAFDFLLRVTGCNPATARLDLKGLIREAQMKTHPDRGGDPQQFKRVMKAAERIQKG